MKRYGQPVYTLEWSPIDNLDMNEIGSASLLCVDTYSPFMPQLRGRPAFSRSPHLGRAAPTVAKARVNVPMRLRAPSALAAQPNRAGASISPTR